MKKWAAVLAAVLLLPALSGCSVLLEREYRSVEPQLEQREESENREYLTADTYYELRSAILSLVQDAREEGIIRVYNSYAGSLSRDVPQAIYEVMQEEPLGAYAVEYIPYETPVRFLNYYEVQLTISYRVTAEELDRIRPATGVSELGELVGKAMHDLQTELVVDCTYYEENAYDVKKLIERQFLAEPATMLYEPVAQVVTYPREGSSRILEIRLDYGQNLLDLQTRRRDLELAAESLAPRFEGLAGETLVREVTAWARETVQADQSRYESYYSGREDAVKDLGFSAYGPICQSVGTPEGVALAAKLLGQQAGCEVLVVSGTRGDRPYHWNLVKVGDVWYHWDLYDLLRGGNVLLQGDETMSDTCVWPAGSMPAAEGETVYHTAVTEEN